VLLAAADLDQVLGLLILREGGQLSVHATSAVRSALTDGLSVAPVLERYGHRVWCEPPREPAPLPLADGSPSGLLYQAFPVPGKPPKYREGFVAPDPGDCVGYALTGAAAIDDAVFLQLRSCDAALLDGTFWSEHEMSQAGVGTTAASAMGHMPIGGPEGSLARLEGLAISRKIYWHINNTNPILRDDSLERRALDAAGFEVGSDGLELTL
jgi:pyrroloquinoline quinone biosynthesis protein B